MAREGGGLDKAEATLTLINGCLQQWDDSLRRICSIAGTGVQNEKLGLLIPANGSQLKSTRYALSMVGEIVT
jgi:hypothetical protein